MIRRPSFPLAPAPWPGGVPLPPLEKKLGAAYDTEWARRYPARLPRVLVSELVTRPVVHAVARPQVEGLDRFAHLAGPFIFAGNHASHIDTPLLLSVIPEPWRHRLVVAGAADYFFDTRLKAGVFALALNTVPIERTRVDRRSARNLEQLIAEGWSLLIFPEGGRSPDGWGQPHRAGAAWLAVRSGAPVVPVHVEGTREMLPRHSGHLRPGTAKVTFGPPLWGNGTGGARELAAAVERSIAELADERASDWWAARRRAAGGLTPALTGPGAGAWRRSWALGGVRARRNPLARRTTSGALPARWQED